MKISEKPALDLSRIAHDLFLAPALPPGQAEAWLQELGFADPALADRRLQHLAGEPPQREAFAALAPDLLRELRDCPAPDLALHHLGRYVRQVEPLSTYRLWTEQPWILRPLVCLFSTSQLLADALIRDPEAAFLFLEPERLEAEKTAAQMAAELHRAISSRHTPERQRNALRRYKRREFLRIGARDLLRLADLKTVTREFSALADACLQVALSWEEQRLQAVSGPPVRHAARRPTEAPAAFAIIGLGKFGAQELNYNSDIDVLFVYDGEGQTQPPTPDGLALDNRTYFDRLARGVLEAIGQRTAEGRVFRVDARLRPGGETGPLVRSLDGYVNYYEAWGSPWESQALLKARFVAGDADLGRRFEALSREVAYGRQLDLAAITSIRENKRRLEARALQEGPANTQVKQGYGGLRDIEFTVQLLQLVHGLTDETVRVANTLEALEALFAGGYLTAGEKDLLTEAYVFLRRVEHQLQIQGEVPRPTLPEDPRELETLARQLGYGPGAWTEPVERFRSAYQWYTERVREICEQLFYHPLPGGQETIRQEITLLLDPLVAHGEGARPLAPLGFRNPAEARRRLIFLAYGEPPMRLPERVQQVFAEIVPALLVGVARTPDPDAAIQNFERFISRAGGREMFYRFLRDHPLITELFCRIGGSSEHLSQILIQHPEYFDYITDPNVMAAPRDRAALRAELAARLAPLPRDNLKLADLRRFKRRELFRIGVRDLIEAADLETTLTEISDLADVCIETALALCPAPLPFAVIGLGKLGGRELHYSSDLDVIFVYEPPAGADRAGRQAAYHQAEKRAEDLLKALGERTREGVVFEVDARLRPFGTEGQLVRTVESYRDYYARQGEPWERLALTRARYVAGDEALAERFLAVAAEFVYGQPLTEEELGEIRRVKRRIETERHRQEADRIDVKLIPGGLLDLEFLAQVGQLRHGPTDPAVRTPNTLKALRALHAGGYLADEDAATLTEAYLWLRRLEMRLQLVHERSSGVLQEDEASLAAAAKRLGYEAESEAARAAAVGAGLVPALHRRLEEVRAIYERLVGVEE